MKKHIPRGAPPLLLTLLIIGIAACRKDDPPQDCPPDLPCATQYGANTFGCYIDGVPWVAKVEPDVLDPSAHPFEVSYDETKYGNFNNNYLKINANIYSKSEPLSYFYIQLKPVTREGEVDFDSLYFLYIDFRLNQKSYEIDKKSLYEFNISKLDTIQRVMSGTFNFTVFTFDDTIKVTNGRFDLKYSPE